MIVFLWTADEPGRFSGVTDDAERARGAAESLIKSCQASMAQVEAAHYDSGFGARSDPRYQRTGRGWLASKSDGDISWQPLRAS